MKGFDSIPSVCGVVLAMAAVVLIPDAQAIPSSRILDANATNYCQAALPVFDGQIRKRPLAVQNEGASNAFVTCSFTHHANGSVPSLITMYAQNNDSSAQDMTCTLVTGYATEDNQYVPKTVNLQSGEQEQVQWSDVDFTGGDMPGGPYSLSCNLLPGVSLNDAFLYSYEDVGG